MSTANMWTAGHLPQNLWNLMVINFSVGTGTLFLQQWRVVVGGLHWNWGVVTDCSVGWRRGRSMWAPEATLCQRCWATSCQCHSTECLHIPSFGQVLHCPANKLWSLACHSVFIFLKTSRFYLISVLLLPCFLPHHRESTFSVPNQF